MKLKNKIFTIALAICLIFPLAFMFTACDDPEPVPSQITTNIAEKTFVVGVPTEFSFSTIANDDAGKMVYGVSNFSDEEAITLLEYYMKDYDVWIEYPRGENYGAPDTGFPMKNATDSFRVTFSRAGEYTFTAYMKTIEGNKELCKVEVTFTVYDAE